MKSTGRLSGRAPTYTRVVEHLEKVRSAVAELESRGLKSWRAAPPIFRACWWLGLPIPPPHFLAPRQAAWFNGVVFGVLLGAAMLVLRGWSWTWPLLTLMSGVMFGWLTASSRTSESHRLRLPAWRDYEPGSIGGPVSPAPPRSCD
ncbi:MAG: DUF6404 family protein [Planctomycetota bacterium]